MSPSSNSFKLFSALTKFITKEEASPEEAEPEEATPEEAAPEEAAPQDNRLAHIKIAQNFLDKKIHTIKGKYRDIGSGKETNIKASLSTLGDVNVNSFYTKAPGMYKDNNDVLSSEIPIDIELIYDKRRESVLVKFRGSSDEIVIDGSFNIDSIDADAIDAEATILFYKKTENNSRGFDSFFINNASPLIAVGIIAAAVPVVGLAAVGVSTGVSAVVSAVTTTAGVAGGAAGGAVGGGEAGAVVGTGVEIGIEGAAAA